MKMSEIPEFTKKRSRQPSINSNVESAVTATESERKTSKDVTMRPKIS